MSKKKDYSISFPAAISLICIIVCFLLPIAHGLTTMSETDAKAQVYQLCYEKLGHTKDELILKTLERSPEGGWIFSLRLVEPATTDGVISGAMTESGHVEMWNEPEEISIFRQLFNDRNLFERSYEDLFHLKQIWEPRLRDLEERDREEFAEHSHNFPFLALINHDIDLPSDTDISYNQARMNADAAILATPGWTEEKLALLDIQMEAYHTPVNSSQPVYQFIYSLGSEVGHRKALYDDAVYTFDYVKVAQEEDRIFGQDLPWYVSVRIDAHTGETVGHIQIEVRPVSDGLPYRFILSE